MVSLQRIRRTSRSERVSMCPATAKEWQRTQAAQSRAGQSTSGSQAAPKPVSTAGTRLRSPSTTDVRATMASRIALTVLLLAVVLVWPSPARPYVSGGPSAAALAKALRAPGVAPRRTGALVLDLRGAPALFGRNADKPLAPAS